MVEYSIDNPLGYEIKYPNDEVNFKKIWDLFFKQVSNKLTYTSTLITKTFKLYFSDTYFSYTSLFFSNDSSTLIQ